MPSVNFLINIIKVNRMQPDDESTDFVPGRSRSQASITKSIINNFLKNTKNDQVLQEVNKDSIDFCFNQKELIRDPSNPRETPESLKDCSMISKKLNTDSSMKSDFIRSATSGMEKERFQHIIEQNGHGSPNRIFRQSFTENKLHLNTPHYSNNLTKSPGRKSFNFEPESDGEKEDKEESDEGSIVSEEELEKKDTFDDEEEALDGKICEKEVGFWISGGGKRSPKDLEISKENVKRFTVTNSSILTILKENERSITDFRVIHPNNTKNGFFERENTSNPSVFRENERNISPQVGIGVSRIKSAMDPHRITENYTITEEIPSRL